MGRRAMCSLFAVLCALGGPAMAAEEIVFIAATNHTMPLSHFQNGIITDGIIKDLGEAIARRLGREARFVSVPPKRVSLTLAGGEADSVCYAIPRWLNGTFNWSKPLITATGVLVARAGAPQVKSLTDLAGKPIGTVAGYRYLNVEQTLGGDFIREEAPSMESNMSKLAVGRMQYAITERTTFDYLARSSGKQAIRVDLEFEALKAQCAFSGKSKIPFPVIEKAVNSLIDDGSIERILARYR